MKELEKKAYEYRLPMETTPEELECRHSKTMTFGNRVITVGHYFNGMRKPEYYGAVYRFTTEKTTCEDPIRLAKASDVIFWDPGHAIEWAIQTANEGRATEE